MACGVRAAAEATLAQVTAGDPGPACLGCGGILKSATISFGRGLVPGDLRRAEQAALECDLLVAVGGSLTVYPVAGVVPTAAHASRNFVTSKRASCIGPSGDNPALSHAIATCLAALSTPSTPGSSTPRRPAWLTSTP